MNFQLSEISPTNAWLPAFPNIRDSLNKGLPSEPTLFLAIFSKYLRGHIVFRLGQKHVEIA